MPENTELIDSAGITFIDGDTGEILSKPLAYAERNKEGSRMQLICHVPDDRYVKISYYLRLTSIPEDTSKPITLKNTVEMNGKYTVTATEDTEFRYYTASGTGPGTPGVLTLSKQSASGNTLTDAEFSLYHVIIDENQEYLVTAVEPVAVSRISRGLEREICPGRERADAP